MKRLRQNAARHARANELPEVIMNATIIGFLTASAIWAAAPRSQPLDDAKILGVLDVATSTEATQAELAYDRTQVPAVKAFAKMMMDQYTEDNERGHAVARHAGMEMSPSEISNDLKEGSNEIIVDLRPLRKGQFDRAYVDAQVRNQQRLIKLIDDVLSEDASLSEIKSYVSDIRDKVEQRVEAAEKTADKLH
jgi:putative membrane protein